MTLVFLGLLYLGLTFLVQWCLSVVLSLTPLRLSPSSVLSLFMPPSVSACLLLVLCVSLTLFLPLPFSSLDFSLQRHLLDQSISVGSCFLSCFPPVSVLCVCLLFLPLLFSSPVSVSLSSSFSLCVCSLLPVSEPVLACLCVSVSESRHQSCSLTYFLSPSHLPLACPSTFCPRPGIILGFLMRLHQTLTSSLIHFSMFCFPIPKSRTVVRENRLRAFQEFPQAKTTPDWWGVAGRLEDAWDVPRFCPQSPRCPPLTSSLEDGVNNGDVPSARKSLSLIHRGPP